MTWEGAGMTWEGAGMMWESGGGRCAGVGLEVGWFGDFLGSGDFGGLLFLDIA